MTIFIFKFSSLCGNPVLRVTKICPWYLAISRADTLVYQSHILTVNSFRPCKYREHSVTPSYVKLSTKHGFNSNTSEGKLNKI